MIKLFKTIQYFSVLLSVVLLAACQQEEKINVVLVTFDTTRADHIGVYGKKRAMTPVVDELAKDGVLYKKALSHIPITLPSHSSIMTGKVPFTHGVRDNGLFTLSDDNLTLAEILKNNGYKTAAAIGSLPLISEFGINQGFSFFNEHIYEENISTHGNIKKSELYFHERTASQVNDALMPWIEENHDSPFYVWFHYFDPHRPHNPPSPYDQNFSNDLYQGEIAYADENFGEIINQLKRLEVYDNTIIVFASDHGEGNGDHDEMTHVSLIYNSTLHVPLIIKYPKQLNAGLIIDQWVGLIDIFPTILNTLGISYESDIQGHVLPLKLNKDGKHEEIYAETLSARFSRGLGEQRGLIKDNFKYIHGPQKELYNLIDDPYELHNIIKSNPEVTIKMKQSLEDYLGEYQNGNISNLTNLSPELLNNLRGLGYIQATSDNNNQFEEKLNDEGAAPQLHIKDLNTISLAKQQLVNGNYIVANRYIQTLLDIDPNNLLALELKIYSDIHSGSFSNVKKSLLNLPKNKFRLISQAKRLFYLAKISLQNGDIIEAKHLLTESEKIEMTTEGQYILSKISLADNDLISQQFHLQNVLSIKEGLINTINELANSYSKSANLTKAEITFNQAIKINPYYQITFYNYGLFLKSVKEYSKAEKQFTRAIILDENYLNAHLALIETLIKMNDIKKAHIRLDVIKKIAPSSQQFINATQLIKKHEHQIL